jgi:hypothetical protein
MGREQETAAAEVERLTRLRDAAEKGSAEHRELNDKLMKARRRLYEIEWGRRASLAEQPQQLFGCNFAPGNVSLGRSCATRGGNGRPIPPTRSFVAIA